MNEQAKREAELHWKYTGSVIALVPSVNSEYFELMQYLYEQAFIHGWKHAEEATANHCHADMQ